MGRTIDTYKEIKEFDFPNMKVRVHIPELTEDERNRRLKAIHKAAGDLLKSTIRSKRNGKEKNQAPVG